MSAFLYAAFIPLGLWMFWMSLKDVARKGEPVEPVVGVWIFMWAAITVAALIALRASIG